MHSRRDLLKFFGIGATIVPIIGGVPELAAPAKLIAEPVVEPVAVARYGMPSAIHPYGDVGISTFEFVSREMRLRCEVRSLVTSMRPVIMDVTSLESGRPYREFIPALADCGECDLRVVFLDPPQYTSLPRRR